MKFLNKIKEVSISILPLVLITLLVHFFVAPFSSLTLLMFLASIVLLIIGESIFLLGVDGSILEMGEIVGNSSNKTNKFFILVIFGILFGFFATVAEPDASILGIQVESVLGINKTLFVFLMGAGVGLMVGFALFRIVANISLKLVMAVAISLVILLVVIGIITGNDYLSISFDAGGASTGIITSPFLIALALGVSISSQKNSESGKFGSVGIASFGPLFAIMVYLLIANKTGASIVTDSSSETILEIALSVLKTSLLSILPLILFFFIYELIFVKLPKQKVKELLFGSLIAFIGLYIFLFGINLGISNMAVSLGGALSNVPVVVCIIVTCIFGFAVTFSEPAVRILARQVEEITGGHIKSKTVLISIALSMVLASIISVLMIYLNVSFNYVILVLYLISLVLVILSNQTFIGIGFDSGGVATGPISSAFLLPLMLGFSGSGQGFGVVGLIAVMPIITIQVLGLIYKVQLKAMESALSRKTRKLTYGMNVYGNLDKLRKQSLIAQRGK
ncbi:MAG: DUF1538 domain-containing protein [bacterium]|nr:DUF1538 domain-containing protein [bacterium]